jgi:hypothetical protein
MGDESSIAALESFIEIFNDHLGTIEVIGGIERFGLWHFGSLLFTRDALGLVNIGGLRALVATAEQRRLGLGSLEIDPVSGTVVDTHFAKRVTDRADIAGVTQAHPINPG